VPGGRHQRACVAALVRGKGTRTVLLTGHFDTVPVEDNGDLKSVAGSAEALRHGLLQRLAVLCSRGSIVCMANWLGFSL